MTSVQAAVRALDRGEVVAFPTETVLGVGADAHSGAALERLVRAKGRPDGKPFTVHLGPSVDPASWAVLDARARALAATFWPGPLTLILPLARQAHPLLVAGGATVGVRVPAHPVAIALLDAFGRGVAASSANRNGEPVATRSDQIAAALGPAVAHIVPGEPAPGSRGSTIVSLVGSPEVLRVGDLPVDALFDLIPELAPR